MYATDSKRRRSPSRLRGYALALLAALLLAGGLAALFGAEPFGSEGSGRDAASGPIVPAKSGYLGQFVDGLVSGISKSDPYEEPEDAEKARLARAYTEIRAGRLVKAARLAEPLGYGVLRYLDRQTGR